MSEPIDYVFLHGGVQGGWVWDETIAALGQQAKDEVGRTLALDVPGCGAKRGRATTALGPDEIAAELVSDIEAEGLRHAVLVGHSQAGTLLPRLLELRPELFRQAVYISCIAPLAGQTVLNFRDSGLPDGGDPEATEAPSGTPTGDLRDALRPRFCNDMSPDEAEAFLAKIGGDAWPALTYAESDWRYDHLEATPASYFVCLRDAAVSVAWQTVFAERLRASSLVRLDAGHQVMNTRPHALAEALHHYARQAP
ncbi:alpha/beta hydrolase [Phenylobacterium sp. LjRoot225]|uniref:alpha/beta fold hydrolase n=1 Tax=Phenylobacterium sp. LjRoot225 TaxID=3342285 RepID=UPI003ECD3FCC